MNPALFEGEIDGKPVALYMLRNANGMVVGITNYGGKIQQLIAPDREGNLADIVLGYDSLEAAIQGAPSVGAFIGRYAGRIENSSFRLDGKNYRLSANNGAHCLHGGVKGTRFRVFDVVKRDESSIEMSYVFADGEAGFPGALALRLVYSLTAFNELVIAYEATAWDKPTVASFTSHAFFNLNGEASGSAAGHKVMICADRCLAMTPELVATGEILSVTGTPSIFARPPC